MRAYLSSRRAKSSEIKNYVCLAPMEKAYRIGLSEASVFPEGPKNKNGGRLSI
jgi:hypothetical protein